LKGNELTNRFVRQDSCGGLVVVGAKSRNCCRENGTISHSLGVENSKQFVWAKRRASLFREMAEYDLPLNAQGFGKHRFDVGIDESAFILGHSSKNIG
jgi:hypothetical protein